jgi:hypothetical protein
MANEEHLKILEQGVATWNLWREENPKIQPNLNEAKLNGARLYNADLFKAKLIGVDLSEADLIEADLYGANLSWANLDGANFTGADLTTAELVGADLFETNLSRATLMFTDLSYARLVETNFEGANFSDCFIYGISTWGLKLQGAKQSAFIITRNDESEITVDNLEIAQFIYLLLNNERIRAIVDTITLKVVLILGRFTPEHKFILDALREELRRRDYVPVLFDFEKPVNRDLERFSSWCTAP